MVMAEAKELCPVSPTDPKHPLYIGTSGALQNSGSVGEVKVENNEISVTVGFNQRYAAAVHERTAVNHRYPGAVNPKAQAKFLSVPLIKARHNAKDYIAEKVKNA